MTNTIRVAAVAAVMSPLLFVPGPVRAQGLCQPTDTIQRCVTRVQATLSGSEDKAAAAETAKAAEKQTPKKTETGLDTINGLSSSVKDFLPLLQLSGVLGGVQTDDTTGIVTVALNTPFLGSTGTAKKDNALQIKAAIDTTAKLFEPLKAQLPAATRDTVAKQLTSSKKDAENVTLHVSYNVSSRRLGRNYERHSDTLDALFEQAMQSVAAPRDTFQGGLNALRQIDLKVDFASARWGLLPTDYREKLEDGLLALMESDAAYDAAIAKAIKDNGLNLYGQLVNNQPQLQLSVSRNFRDDLFGPDLISGRISYEHGIGNSLNAALGDFIGRCTLDKVACLKQYAAFAGNSARLAAIKAGSRLAAYAEFVTNDPYTFSRPEQGLDLIIEEGTGWTAGFDYGRLVAVDDTGVAGGRVDASVRWEAPADKNRDRRFVASLTITKKVGEVSIPFGLVFANKERFLTDIDKGLGAHVGLKFNLFPGLN